MKGLFGEIEDYHRNRSGTSAAGCPRRNRPLRRARHRPGRRDVRNLQAPGQGAVSSKAIHKCGLARSIRTGGPASDIRLVILAGVATRTTIH